jgi:hypothetical protein
MANVAHASLTGAQLHEPKGAASAALGTVYVADGAGSGSWSNVGTSAFTGMIADFPTIVPPSGWLELDGSIISTATYPALFAVMAVSSSGTRTSGSPIITSIPSTTNFLAGHYVFGTGISAGTTILSVDSATQITLSGNAGSTGTSSFHISPWPMNTGTITLPDTKTAGRYRRSQGPGTKTGDLLADQNKAHTHAVSGTTSGPSANHTHTSSGTSGTMNSNITHQHTVDNYDGGSVNAGGGVGGSKVVGGSVTSSANIDHTHFISLTSGIESVAHNHTFSTVSASEGGTEARPLSLVLMTCIKT